MKRYRHYMTSDVRIRTPRQTLCVSVQSQIVQGPFNGRIRPEELTGWAASLVSRTRKSHHVGTQAHGDSPSGFWDWLAGVCAGRRTLSIVSWGCTRTLSLLDFWQLVENGEITSVAPQKRGPMADSQQAPDAPTEPGEDQGQSAVDPSGTVPEVPPMAVLPGDDPGNGPDPAVQVLQVGTWCLEDPPNIITFWLWGEPCRITWWDARNWGVPSGEGERSLAYDVRRLAGWYRELCTLTCSAGGGAPSVTAAAWALSAFRRQHYDGGIYVHSNRDALALEGLAYIGGRCECYRLGRWPGVWTMVDMRSAYLWAAANVAVPVRLIDGPQRYRGMDRLHPPAGQGVIAHCLVDVWEPVAPYRRGHDVVYPLGRFWTTICGPEIALVEQYGIICEVDGAAIYETDYALAKWACAIYALRIRAESCGDKAVSAAIKAAGVALIGKLGQRKRSWDRVSQFDGGGAYGEVWGADAVGRPCRYRYIGGECWQAVDRGWSEEACPAIAAWITSATRARLWELQMQAGRNHVAYCDTDCLIVDDTGLSQLEIYPASDPTLPLGSLTVRHQGQLEVWGPKHYRIGNKTVLAGVRRGVLTGTEDGRRHWWTAGAGQQIAEGHRPSEVARPYSPPRPESYRHGTVLDDGTVAPIRVREE